MQRCTFIYQTSTSLCTPFFFKQPEYKGFYLINILKFPLPFVLTCLQKIHRNCSPPSVSSLSVSFPKTFKTTGLPLFLLIFTFLFHYLRNGSEIPPIDSSASCSVIKETAHLCVFVKAFSFRWKQAGSLRFRQREKGEEKNSLHLYKTVFRTKPQRWNQSNSNGLEVYFFIILCGGGSTCREWSN